MIFSKNRSLEDTVIELLVTSPNQVKHLHSMLLKGTPNLSLRAVYKTVNQLIDAGVLLKVGKIVRIDEEWVQILQKKLVSIPSLRLAEGERMTHSFTSISHLDAYWTTIALQLEEYEKDGQIFFYNPHNFWSSVPEREQNERHYFQHFSESKLHAFFTLGGDFVADKECKKEYQDEYLQIDTRSLPSIRRTDHLTVIGDYIITVRIAKNMAIRIDQLYASGESIHSLLPSLLKLYSKGFHSRFVLENNPTKAQKLKKKLSLNFYFKLN